MRKVLKNNPFILTVIVITSVVAWFAAVEILIAAWRVS